MQTGNYFSRLMPQLIILTFDKNVWFISSIHPPLEDKLWLFPVTRLVLLFKTPDGVEYVRCGEASLCLWIFKVKWHICVFFLPQLDGLLTDRESLPERSKEIRERLRGKGLPSGNVNKDEQKSCVCAEALLSRCWFLGLVITSFSFLAQIYGQITFTHVGTL